MSIDEHSAILPLEVDGSPTRAARYPPPFGGPTRPSEDESAALLDRTEDQSSGEHDEPASTPSSRYHCAIVLAAATAIAAMLSAFAVMAIAVERPRAATAAPPAPVFGTVSSFAPAPAPAFGAASAPAPARAPVSAPAPVSVPAAPTFQTAGAAWGTSMYDVPVPQNVSMPPYETDVRSQLPALSHIPPAGAGNLRRWPPCCRHTSLPTFAL